MKPRGGGWGGGGGGVLYLAQAVVYLLTSDIFLFGNLPRRKAEEEVS